MPKDCKNCNSETMDKYVSLIIEDEKLKGYVKLLETALDNKEELNKYLREEIDQLKIKLGGLE